MCPCLQTELGGCYTKHLPEATRDRRRRKVVVPRPLVEGKNRILEQITGKYILPVVTNTLDWPQLRAQPVDRFTCIALGGAHYYVGICDTADAQIRREAFDEKIQYLGATTAEPIQVCIESIVKEYVA